MAAHSSKDLNLAKTAHKFKQKLEVLGCPFTDDVDESWILEILFKPGEHRIRLLQWLFIKFDAQLHDVLDPQYVRSDSKMDSRIQRLLYVASSLGLCAPEDADLIRGVESVSKQTAFLDHLMDLVYVMDRSEDLQERSLSLMRSPGTVSQGSSLREQFDQSCWLVDSIADQKNIDSILSSEAKILPPDITKQLDLARQERQESTESRIPDLKSLDDLVAGLTADLQKHEDILTELKKAHEFPKEDGPRTENLQRTLKLALSELSQLVIGFTYCFDNELQQWCNKTTPQLSGLGPTFRKIHGLLDHFTQMLTNLSDIRTSHTILTRQVPEQLRIIAEGSSTKSKDDRAIWRTEDYREMTSILEDSLRRGDSTQTNTSLNLLNTTLLTSSIKL